MTSLYWVLIPLGCLLWTVYLETSGKPKRNRHQECLKRIYEMEQKMPEIEGIPWVYPDGRTKHWHQSRWTYLSWEEFPLEVYEPKKIEPIPVQYTQIYPSVKVGKPTPEELALRGLTETASGNYIDDPVIN